MLSIFKYFSIGDGYVHNYQKDLPPHVPIQLHVSIIVAWLMSCMYSTICSGHKPVHAWFLVIAFVLEVGVCVYVCVCVCVCVFVCACLHVCLCVCSHVCVCLSVSVSVSISLCVCVILCICMHECVCIYVLAPKVKVTNGMIQIPYN